MNVGAIDRVQRTFDAVPKSARAARQFVTEILRGHRAPTSMISDYELVVSELATNIIEHGNGSHLVISVNVADPEWWEVEVVGGTSAAPHQVFHPDTWTVAGAAQASGRGLGIVRHLMDHVAADTTDGQISIRCRRRRAKAR
ncbi:MAG: ATP-binding protein [Actinomycetota bacterium]|nr:ATP-binding protein [Actinomycetota bacterium]